jgi:NHLM bacteriocin system ABC transporter ATP-binding protein
MSTDTASLITAGTLWIPGVNKPFLLQDPDTAWVVRSGKLDLFLVPVRNGELAGARHFVMRIEEGSAAFGMGEVSGDEVVVGAATPETELLVLSTAALRHAALNGFEEDVRRLVEDWTLRFSVAACGATPPRTFAALTPPEEIQVGDESQAVMPKDGVVWVKHLTGVSRFVAHADLPVDGVGWFPVSKHGWLQAEPETRLLAIDFADLTANDPAWQGLHEFHRTMARCLIQSRAATEEQERTRLHARAAADSARVESAITRLAVPLAPELEMQAGVDTVIHDPLMSAAMAVGRAQGIEIKAHPDLAKGRHKDPVAMIARASSIRTRRVILKASWWKQDNGPMLAFRDRDNRPLALIPRNARTYDVYDPVERTTRTVTQKLAGEMNAFAYVFYRPFPPKALSTAELIAFGLHGCRSDIRLILLVGLATGLLGMFTPFATGILFDTVIPGAQRPQLVQLSVILVTCAICTAMFTLTRSFAVLRLEGKMDASIQAAVWDRLLNLPVPFFRDYTAGDLATRGMGINQIRQTLTGSTLASIMSGVFSIFSFALLFYYSWRLALMATGLILVAFLVSLACGVLQVRYQRDMSKVRGRISGSVLQFISGIAKFRVSGTEERAFAAWSKDFARQKGFSIRARRVQNGLTVFNAAFPVVCSATIFWYTAYLMTQPLVTPLTTGEFLAFNAAFTQFLTAMLQLSASLVAVLNIVPLYERAKPIFQTLPEVDVAKTNPGELSGDVDVNHVVFRYRPDTPVVLNDLSLHIGAGQFVAFVGASGCGKSTLMRLLLGFEKPESGAVYYDGQDLAGLDPQAVRRQMGVVLQNGKLLSGDIFTNIVGSAPLTVDDAWEAARMCGLDNDIKNMPMGMHTVISEGGGTISGGQRQRLLIARAIVGRPRILLFDEATSALDNQTQAIVSESLNALQATRIVIAHRLSTILKADRIFVLDKGRVVQSGTYDELIRQEGRFADLARRQLV